MREIQNFLIAESLALPHPQKTQTEKLAREAGKIVFFQIPLSSQEAFPTGKTTQNHRIILVGKAL